MKDKEKRASQTGKKKKKKLYESCRKSGFLTPRCSEPSGQRDKKKSSVNGNIPSKRASILSERLDESLRVGKV